MLRKFHIVLPFLLVTTFVFTTPSHAGIYGVSKLARAESSAVKVTNTVAHIKPNVVSSAFKPVESAAFKPNPLAFKPSSTMTLPHTANASKSFISVPKVSIPKPTVPSATHGGHKLLHNRAWEGPYGHLKNHPSVGSGKNYTQAAKNKIYQENYLRNGLQLRDDINGKVLTRGNRHLRGFTPPKNEAQIDHVFAKSRGGSNSFGNAQVLSRQHNLIKSNVIH